MLIAKDGTMIHINGNSLICSDGKIYQLNGRILTGPNGTVSMNVGSMAEAAGIAAGFHGGRKLYKITEKKYSPPMEVHQSAVFMS